MQRVVIVLLLLCSPIAGQNKLADTPKTEAVKPLRRVAFTPEQNRLVLQVQQQMKDAQTRLQAILDTIAATNNLDQSTLNEIKPGEFELKEAPPKETPKPKEERQ